MPDLTLWGLFVVASMVLLLKPAGGALYRRALGRAGASSGAGVGARYPSRHYHPHHRGGGQALGPHRVVGACLLALR